MDVFSRGPHDVVLRRPPEALTPPSTSATSGTTSVIHHEIVPMNPPSKFATAAQLSPRRHTTQATTTDDLTTEQLTHFGIDPTSDHGKALAALVTQLFTTNIAAHDLWTVSSRTLSTLNRSDRVAWFNAKRFVCFQIAKVLDTLQ